MVAAALLLTTAAASAPVSRRAVRPTPDGPTPAVAGLQVELQVAVAPDDAIDGLGRLGGQRGAAQAGVQEDARGVDDRPERGPSAARIAAAAVRPRLPRRGRSSPHAIAARASSRPRGRPRGRASRPWRRAARRARAGRGPRGPAGRSRTSGRSCGRHPLGLGDRPSRADVALADGQADPVEVFADRHGVLAGRAEQVAQLGHGHRRAVGQRLGDPSRASRPRRRGRRWRPGPSATICPPRPAGRAVRDDGGSGPALAAGRRGRAG